MTVGVLDLPVGLKSSPAGQLQTGRDDLDGVAGQQSHQGALLVVHQGGQVQGGAPVDGRDGGVGPGGDEAGDDRSVAVECCLHQGCPAIDLVSLVHIRTSICNSSGRS